MRRCAIEAHHHARQRAGDCVDLARGELIADRLVPVHACGGVVIDEALAFDDLLPAGTGCRDAEVLSLML